MSPREFHRLLDRLSPEVRDAFEAAVADLADGADRAALERAIAAQDADAALQALNLDPAVFDDLRESLRRAFREGGRAEVAAHPPPSAPGTVAAVIRFALGNPRAEAAARELGSTLIREVLDETRDLVRQRVATSIADGVNPRVTARTIVGMHDRTTGHRTGGIIGLTEAQAGWARNAEAELSRDPPDPAYFQRQARDRRYDAAVRRAIRDGKPLDAAMREKIVGRYQARLTKLRGEAIARTEATAALNAGRYEAMEQLIERGVTTPDLVTGTWDATLDARVRPDHRAMNNQKRTFGDPFVAPDGSRLRYPGDSSLGAGADQVVAAGATRAGTWTGSGNTSGRPRDGVRRFCSTDRAFCEGIRGKTLGGV